MFLAMETRDVTNRTYNHTSHVGEKGERIAKHIRNKYLKRRNISCQ